MLNRSVPPVSHPIQAVAFPKPKTIELSNGIDLHIISLGDQEVFKLELVFPAGAIFANKPGISGLTAQLMKRGTQSLNSFELNEAFDFYGAYWDISNQLDNSTLTIYSLCKHLPNLLPLVLDILENSLISEAEFTNELEIEVQKNKHNWEKTSFAANQYFRKHLFANDPYGRISNEQSLRAIEVNDLKLFYENFWKGSKPTIILSGKISNKEIEAVVKSFESLSFKQKTDLKTPELQIGKDQVFYQEKENALQTSIRFGKIGVQRTNPDYFKFAVLNTVLGGFFGSRLQKNIREEKGFTYGISSSNVALQRAAYWIVGTDVNKTNANQTIEEINKEIKKLQTELVSEDELSLVKNYLMGSFVGELTQAFEISEKVKIICLENLPNDFYDQFQSQILSCTSKDLIELANTYWEENQFFDIRVG
ncbi:insulinase family protein [Sandaracinomonas limnophila]|uniref:Insulinase family protein n=1 Tax=Sandaracinomonas limnophila TaxID=1862386 RepID=A0A437PU62_9BACT|nr:pitrilysin family protein [Sandaracinomonas limnophila]RVU25786.1 insulinase family protein [Sandaracinomonas limnophila]